MPTPLPEGGDLIAGAFDGNGRMIGFVFGMTDAVTLAPLLGTVIFEYKLPPTRPAFGPTSLLNWATAWHALSDAAALGPIGSPAYQRLLADIEKRIDALPFYR